eukprot:TRINITY_DN17_c0_g2_i8.p1 TRINITY_DN17_c0_g2~~TRINITY_DN17_c0_g2_i8.p1  ORF type:complete len:873 (+),score=350.38 TRINITY_DN17_c0_g2_i8:1585-4203(+)
MPCTHANHTYNMSLFVSCRNPCVHLRIHTPHHTHPCRVIRDLSGEAAKMSVFGDDPAWRDSDMSEAATNVLLVIAPLLGLLFAVYNTLAVRKVRVLKDHEFQDATEHTGLMNEGLGDSAREGMKNIEEISELITNGAKAFLWAEYQYMAVFVVVFSVVIVILIGAAGGDNAWRNGGLSAVAFVVGCLTSIISGYIGMRIAVYTNSRTALQAWGFWTGHVRASDRSACYTNAFRTAFQGGCVMGFSLVSLGLLSLFVLIHIFKAALGSNSIDDRDDRIQLFECIAAFGLGGSSIACFGRVGGGIFTKAADVGADLVGKVVQGLPEDSPENPGVIADCIGDNVGDIAGMGSDLFGSFGEATCAALVLAAYSKTMCHNWSAMMYPLLITAVGILVCIATSMFVIAGVPKLGAVHGKADIEPVLKYQLIISTVLMTAAAYPLTATALPSKFEVSTLSDAGKMEVHNYEAYLCVITGLWCGLIIGLTTEYYTSNAHTPVQELADACVTGAATNVIGGLAVGYVSAIIPIFAMAVTVYLSFNMCLMYGIALAALGILSTMATGLTIDAYGPISDNAGGIVEMSELEPEVRDCTDDLDAAGNTTAAIGKGFAIASAAFVGLALYSAFVTHAGMLDVNLLDSRTFPGLMVGAMLPAWFSAMTMKSVNLAAMEMVIEIKRQFDAGIKDHNRCVAIATQGSLKEMIAPGMLVMLSPIVCGILFGKEALSGLLPGAMVAGVQMAISMSNTGGAWDNAKKYVEAGMMKVDAKGNPITVKRMLAGGDEDYSPEMHDTYDRVKKGHEIHKAAVVGDTVGDPLKDTSGPALNILVKLMAIISVVFVPVVTSDKLGGVLFNHAFKDFTHCAVDGNRPDSNHTCVIPSF